MPESLFEADELTQLTTPCGIHQTHSVQFYEQDSSFFSESSEFIAAALNKGSSAIVIVTKAHRDGLAAGLKMRGVDVAASIEQGRYLSLDADEALAQFMVNGVPDPNRFVSSMQPIFARANVASNGIVVLGEMVAVLCARGDSEAAIQLERYWNRWAQEWPMTLRCAYPMSGFCEEEDGNQLLSICAEHAHVIPCESYMELESEGERHRAITHLQQRARVLESEITLRKRVQQQLERREAELADFLENAVEGVQQVGADHKIRWANRSMLSLLGFTREEFVGHDLSEFHVHRRTFEEFWQKLMRQENIYDFPAELRCKDGSVRHVLIHSNGFWKGAKFVHTRCFIRDVTDQKRMEEALRTSEKLATTGRLAATIAHEINNPLEALSNLFYLLKSHRSLDDTARSYATLADKELHRVAHITKQMLSFYRHSAAPVPLRLSEILDGTIELYEAKLIRRNIAVHRHYSAEEIVWGFPSDIRQLFANLLGNAIEASGSNRIIRLRISNSPDWTNRDRRGVRISIADSGSGISLAARKKLFEPFFTTKGEGGTGLGLWVSKGIVQKHEGTIRFRSSVRPGHSGTMFSVFLPARRGSEAARNLGWPTESRPQQPPKAA
jgi:PAS domain S-box-containing protein